MADILPVGMDLFKKLVSATLRSVGQLFGRRSDSSQFSGHDSGKDRDQSKGPGSNQKLQWLRIGGFSVAALLIFIGVVRMFEVDTSAAPQGTSTSANTPVAEAAPAEVGSSTDALEAEESIDEVASDLPAFMRPDPGSPEFVPDPPPPSDSASVESPAGNP